MADDRSEYLKEKIEKDSREGTDTENRFGLLVPGYVKSTTWQNIYEHWDIKISREIVNKYLNWLLPKGVKEIKLDIKGIKSYQNKKSDEFNYLEIKNVKGGIGWAYGQADYFVFELLESWIIVSKKEVQKIIEVKTKGKEIVRTNELYGRYQREKRLDEMVRIKTQDLLSVCRLKIKK